MVAPSLIVLAATGLLPAQAGWIQPNPESLERSFGVRYTVDLGAFELLQTNAEEWTMPLISSDRSRVYVGTRVGRLEARDLVTNEVLWKRLDMGTIGYAMLEFQGTLVLGSDSDLVALNQSNGKERWRVKLDAKMGGMPSVSGATAVLPIRPNGFVAVDLKKGEILWRVKRPTPDNITVRGQAQPAIDAANNRVFLGFSDGTLQAVSFEDGTSSWVTSLGTPREFFADVDAGPLLVDGGRHLIVASYNAGLYKLKAENGENVWKKPVLRISALTDAGGGLLIGTTGYGQVIGLGAGQGKVRWRYRVKKGAPTRALVVDSDLIAFGVSRGPITFVERTTGRPVQLISPGSGLSVPPAYVGPDMAVISNKGMFMLIRRGAGSDVSG